MRLFLYYITHSFLNTLKKLLKTWVAIFLVLMVGGGLVGGVIGSVIARIEEGSETVIEETVEDDGSSDIVSDTGEASEDEDDLDFGFSFSFEDNIKKYGLTPAAITDFVISVLFLVILATNVANSKSSGKIFLPADVPMLFAAPIKPQSVLMFRLTCTLGMSFFLSLFMLYQIPNLMINAKLGFWGALSCVIVYMLTLMFSTLIQVAFYTLTSKIENGTDKINKFLIGFYGLIGAGFIVSITVTKQEIVPAAMGYFANPATHMVPFWGWLRGFSYNAVTGNLLLSGIYLGLFLVSCILIVVFIWKMKADFYEDAMFAAERKAEQIENAKRSTNGATVIREKDRKASLDRDGFHFGSGANVFFFKAVYNRFRFAKLKIFSTTMIIYIITAVFTAFVANRYGTGDMFFIPACAMGVISFYRTLGDPIREDTSRDFFLLIPEKGYSKIMYSLLGCLAVNAIDLLAPMLVAAIMMGTNPLVALVWFLFILSISFFATNVGTFIALSVPGESAKTIKTVLQMIFMYFGLGPSAIAVVLGIVLNQMVLALAVGLVINFVIGFLVSLLLPLFLGRK